MCVPPLSLRSFPKPSTQNARVFWHRFRCRHIRLSIAAMSSCSGVPPHKPSRPRLLHNASFGDALSGTTAAKNENRMPVDPASCLVKLLRQRDLARSKPRVCTLRSSGSRWKSLLPVLESCSPMGYRALYEAYRLRPNQGQQRPDSHANLECFGSTDAGDPVVVIRAPAAAYLTVHHGYVTDLGN